jgi:hypothetical protein
MWSGYVNVTSEDWLFYWCAEGVVNLRNSIDVYVRLAEAKDGSSDAPLVFWTNGGPVSNEFQHMKLVSAPNHLFAPMLKFVLI